jgi:tetratricopeptide (TPR) repeat protein
MSPARRPQVEPLDDEERVALEAQTRRNLEGMELEQAGQVAEAIALYEQNVADGFSGDWPYSRLVSIYERQAAYGEAERVLRRAIEVTRAGRRKPAPDRRALLQGLQGRLRLLKKTAQAARQKGSAAAARGHSFVPLPMIDPRQS